jgi:D-3-phosphoglycerate dehydrogenase / 2-oxoglutarate reductase
MKVLLADKFPARGIEDLRALGCEIVLAPELEGEALAEALSGEEPQILVVRGTRVEASHLDAAPSLALVIRAGAGVNTIDVKGAAARGIYVANCPGKNSVAVAELAFAHILSLDRRLVDGALDLRRGVWNKKEYSRANGILGSTLGLLGVGGIGREMIARAHAFGMAVVGWSRSLTAERAEQLGIAFAESPTEVARRADVLSIHLALTPETRGFVGAELLAATKPGAMVINTSRGEVVDSAALERAVREKNLRAGLDVFVGEPTGGTGELEPGLFALPGVQGTHHIGASTEQAQTAVADETVHIVGVFWKEGRVPNCVNLAARSPATHLLVVRHLDRVGVLAGVLDVLRRAAINVQEAENVVFAGAEAASARLQLDSAPSPDVLAAVRASSPHVLAATLRAL